MSAGDHFRRGQAPSDIAHDAVMATIAKDLRRKRTIDRGHDLPYLAGYSNDGKTIYIDRHIPKSFSYLDRTINTDRFLVLHEKIEKTLIDSLGYGYWRAHHHAEKAEEDAEDAAGIPHGIVQKFFAPYIKADAHERLIKVPADLDLTPYLAKPVDRVLLACMHVAMGGKASKQEAGYGQGSARHRCGICEYYKDHPGDNCLKVEGHVGDWNGCEVFFERKASLGRS